MYSGFLGFLYENSYISAEQAEKVLFAAPEYVVNYELMALYFFQLTEEQMVEAKETLSIMPNEDFGSIVNSLGFSTEAQNALYISEGGQPDFIHAQVLCTLGILNLHDVSEYLLFYSLENVAEESPIYLTPLENQQDEPFEDLFAKSYQNIVLERLHSFFGLGVQTGEIRLQEEVEAELFVCQELISNSSFLVGIITDYPTLKEFVIGLNEKSDARHTAHSNLKAQEDDIDFICEFLNNTNGKCTYMFDVDFDLGLPQWRDYIKITAPKIYRFDFYIDSYTLSFIAIYENTYNLEQVGLEWQAY